MQDHLTIRVWGPLALFTQPHFAADPMTAPVMDPSKAKGILRAIYQKPEFEWEIVRIHIMRPIRYQTIKQKALKSGSKWNDEADRTLRTTTVLVDVEYFIEARLFVNTLRTTKTHAAYMGEALKRMGRGEQWSVPCFGMREYVARWELWTDPIPQALPIDMDLGSLMFDLRPVDMTKDRWEPLFWRAEIKNGVLEVPKGLYDRERRKLMDARRKVSPPKPDHEHSIL